ncbi:hypothetical protein ACFX1R_003955 [Malus domestica]
MQLAFFLEAREQGLTVLGYVPFPKRQDFQVRSVHSIKHYFISIFPESPKTESKLLENLLVHCRTLDPVTKCLPAFQEINSRQFVGVKM